MPKGLLFVGSGPVSAEREDEYNDWYEGHLDEILRIRGFTAARRLRSLDGKGTPYAALYEIEADDLQAAVDELLAAGERGEVSRTDAVSRTPPPVMYLLEDVITKVAV